MTGATANALEVDGLEVRFGEKRVLSNLSFEVRSGDTLAIIGPNGAGKTVLFQALIGALRYGGSIRWGPGTRLGYVPQKLDIERDLPLTGVDFLRAKAHIARAPRGDVDRMLSLVGLSPTSAREAIGTLSGGQFQEQGLTLLLISHELTVVYRYASAVLCLGRGRPCFGPPDEVLTPEVMAQAYGAPVRFHRHGAHN
jgi:zinc transport system ATP-binding protein